jgi:RHS repeat-associated protein
MLKENEVESYAYGGYGNPVELLVTQDILSSGPLYTGKEFDSRTRTYYFGARFFDADLGVWLTPDPAGQFFYPYGFGGDPVNGVDRDGRFLRWSLDKGGMSIGFNLTPIGIPWGLGVTGRWENGGSIGGYNEVGYAVGGTGFGSGVTSQQGYSYGLRNGDHNFYQNASAWGGVGGWNAGVGGGVNYNASEDRITSVNASVSAGYGFVGVNYNYDFVSGGWSVGAGLQGRGGEMDQWGGSLGVSYGSSGWNFSTGGSYDADPFAEYEELSMVAKRIEPSESDAFGHYWIEDGNESYGFWPLDRFSENKDALVPGPGEVNGVSNFDGTSTTDPHHGDPGNTYKIYARKEVPGSNSAYYRAQLRLHAAFYPRNYGVFTANDCHTFQNQFLRQNGMLIKRQ